MYKSPASPRPPRSRTTSTSGLESKDALCGAGNQGGFGSRKKKGPGPVGPGPRVRLHNEDIKRTEPPGLEAQVRSDRVQDRAVVGVGRAAAAERLLQDVRAEQEADAGLERRLLGHRPAGPHVELRAQRVLVVGAERDVLVRLGDAEDCREDEVVLRLDLERDAAAELEGEVVRIPVEAEVHVLE